MALPTVTQAVPPVQFSAATNYAVAGGPVGIAVADLNHDNWPDLVTVNQSGNSISVLLGLGGGTFQSPTNYPVASNPVFVTVGDFDTNGQPDVVTASYAPDGAVSVLSGKGDGTFFTAPNWPAGIRPNIRPQSSYGRQALATAAPECPPTKIPIRNGLNYPAQR